jgi:raffinose/stachyose/melibiose transport system substrate-binding protein
MNVEGFWYNKKLFAKAGIEIPKTWDDLTAACQKLKSMGIQPIVAGGKDKWPLSRLVNAYVMRKLGVDAMERAVAGKLSFTDPGFIEAAKAIQDMAKSGYLGAGTTTVDYATSTDIFLSGKAAMIYNGSWFTENLTDAKRNTLGDSGVGFFNIPLVKGGVGTASDYSVNCGTILCLAQDKYDAATADWVKFVFTRLGDYAMQTYGAKKGYTVSSLPSTLSPYTKIVAEELGKVKNAGLWFEASFDSKTSSLAQDSVQALVLGITSPTDFFKKIDKSVKEAAGR